MPPHTVKTLNDFAPNGWEKMQLHELTQIMWQKDMTFAECLNNTCVSVPEAGIKEDIMLQSCELQITRDDPKYPTNAMHVFAQNEHCDEWNARKLASLPGTLSASVVSDGKKDNCAQLVSVSMPERPHETGNLRKILEVKVGARLMITTNIDVSDGLTNGAMGFVSNTIMDRLSQDIKAI